MADIWVGVNGADEALRQVNAEMLGGARALADQAGATVVAIVWGASAAGHAKALASWGADRVVVVESEAAPAPEAVARTLARLAAESAPAVVLLADGAESRVAAPLLAEAWMRRCSRMWWISRPATRSSSRACPTPPR